MSENFLNALRSMALSTIPRAATPHTTPKRTQPTGAFICLIATSEKGVYVPAIRIKMPNVIKRFIIHKI